MREKGYNQMKYNIEKEESKFSYIQLYEQLREDIVKGILPYGVKLPSKRLLAEETGVSVITVEHAYSILCEEGYVEAKQRKGYFSVYKENDFVSFSEYKTRETAKKQYSKNVKCDFPFTVLSRTMRKVLAEFREEILIKSPNQGCMELRQALSRYLARSNGMLVRPEQIIIGSGAEYFYGLIVQLIGKDKKIALENPSYEKIRQVYEANDIVCDMLDLGSDGILSTELERTDATVLHITPFHSFPSGVTASASKRQEYLRWTEGRQGYIIEDNYDSELTVSKKNEDTLFSLAEKGNVIYLNTFSQTIAPSMRIGYMVLPIHLKELFEEKLGFYSCCVPVFEQYLLAELIDSGDFERHINRIRRARRKAKINLVI